MKYHVLSLGPARMDVFVKLPEDQVDEVCSIDRKRCMIELGFGEKIPVQSLEFAVGGNTGNNAVGLSRLGLKVAMVGALGSGYSDKMVLESLQKEKVETRFVKQLPVESGFGVVINYQEERTILSYYPSMAAGFDVDSDVTSDWIYLTTAGKNYEEFYAQAISWAKAHNTKIAFNPGSRQIKENKIKEVLAVADLLFVNREEGNELLKTDLGGHDLTRELAKLGPKIVVVTDGPAGAYCFDGQKDYFAPIVEAPVVERTGAGDAFAVGFMGAIMHKKSVEEALVWGSKNSASVLGFVGPQKGLLTLEKIS
ncbi:carbohydrate kinase family protein [Candidatus Amesbacteria bacterium]|nr:carbohydrate kinase family protein [Candidatus Amesbacteria bacterium]